MKLIYYIISIMCIILYILDLINNDYYYHSVENINNIYKNTFKVSLSLRILHACGNIRKHKKVELEFNSHNNNDTIEIIDISYCIIIIWIHL